jgi:hypothetical protein
MNLMLDTKQYPLLLEKIQGVPVVMYKTDEMETFSKAELIELKRLVKLDEVILRTNAGIDLHTREGNKYQGVEVQRVRYDDIKDY